MSEPIFKVQDLPGFVKEPDKGAILQTDVMALQSYKNQKKAREADKQRINKLEQEIQEIRSLINKLLEIK